ncbi:MAG: hypothetical protein ACR2I2_03200 [Bryobacteraceae bacterium]
MRAPGFVNVDLGIHGDFIYRERFRLRFRGEAFNIFNHPERPIQLAMKFYF